MPSGFWLSYSLHSKSAILGAWGAFFQVDVHMGEGRVGGHMVQAGLFEGWVVVVCLGCPGRCGQAIFQEFFGEVIADEADCAGY